MFSIDFSMIVMVSHSLVVPLLLMWFVLNGQNGLKGLEKILEYLQTMLGMKHTLDIHTGGSGQDIKNTK